MMQRTVSLDSRGTGRVLVALVGMLAAFTLLSGSQRALANHGGAHDTTGWIFFKSVTPQPACTPGLGDVRYWNRRDCGTVRVDIGNTAAGNTTKLAFFGPSGAQLGPTETGTRSAAGLWNFNVTPSATWEAGTITARVVEVNGQSGNFGETQFFHNLLGANVSAGAGTYRPGDPVPITGRLFELWHKPSALIEPPTEIDVAGTFLLRAVWPDGTTRGPFGPFTANAGGVPGAISATLPGSATAGLTAGQDTGFRATVAVEVVNAAYTDPSTGAWAAQRAGAAPAKFAHEPNALMLENSFVSSVGWVKPGAAYPFRVFVRNYTATAVSGAQVTIPAPDGTTFTGVTTLSASDTASISGGTITWTLGTVPAAVGGVPAMKTLVVQARTDTLGQDPRIVWKDLSSTATLSYGSTTITSQSRGPKVIPPRAEYETARYGYRPFAVVPADYFDRKHKAVHTGDALSDKVNSPDVPGSTFNLYQEMSYGQLFPNGTVPSSGLASAGWDVEWKSDRHRERGFQFTTPVTQGACYGTSFKDLKDSAVYPERIRDGWYQLPGDTGYYGGDTTSFANLAAPEIQFIDSACGPISKSVYDAAHIADPEIDYSDYDTDKDGVVDFFMLVFVGLGGNGASQGLTADPDAVPPYDNIWPHSFSLEAQYTDPETGLKGYISDDQLKDLQGRPLYYTDSSRQQMTAQETAFPVYVRVGPYNVNPESAIDQASVISHEYGHSLGLPDFYSSPGSGRSTLGDWNLMATDKSQHMDVFSKQELGWLVPRVLDPGESQTVNGWRDSKVNTHRIDWVDPNGNPYTLTGPSVNNGEGYVAKLPGKRVLDPAKVPSGQHVWWSTSGDDFNCTPEAGRNLDIFLPRLKELPAGTPVTLTFKSYWDMEWDFDYGFVMAAVRNGDTLTYESLPSANGYTTPQSTNPNTIDCQLRYGNGITGTSGSYAAGTQDLDRNPLLGDYPKPVFLADEYDLTAYAGRSSAIRFSYSTDGGVARPGWFIDDVKITTGDGTVLYESNFENGGDEPELYNGGCKGELSTSDRCTGGWTYLNAADRSALDHAYYLELRDRSGFDMDGKGQNDRAAIAFLPGLLLEYTNEAGGYGNTGESSANAPNQSPLDSVPQAGNTAPNLNDAAFTEAAGDKSFSDSKTAARPGGWVDNYDDEDSEYPDHFWHFDYGCLSFTVDRMTGRDIALPFNLEGDVSFTTGSGCAAFDYGYGVPNRAPTAVAQAKPTSVQAGDPVTLDGSASFDDIQPATELSYAWDVDGNGTFESTGQTIVHTYQHAGSYAATLEVTDAQGLSSTDSVTITVTAPPADLVVSAMSAANNKSVREGQKVTIRATITNVGQQPAGPSQTRFVLDGSTVLGVVNTPAILAGGSATASVDWDTRNVSGQHVIAAAADSTGVVAESNEQNNGGQLTLTVKGNKVQNSSFEQSNASGTGPASWSGESTAAGSATWSDGGSHGSKSASTTGNGGNAALAGSPTWTSDPFAVAPGETLDFVVSVNALGASSAPTASLAFVGAVGQLLDQVTLVTAPLTTVGFQTIEQAVTVPSGAVQARVVLTGFAPTDVATAGTVAYDAVGVFSR